MKAKVNDIDVYYELHGKEGAPWLTLSHSLACSVRMWDEQIASFKDRYRILAYDTRGHGNSGAPAGDYTLEQLADDLKGLLDHLKIAKTHYCGLSMGGMIGQTFALKYPGILQTLVLADTSSRIPPEVGPLWEERIKVAQTQGMQPLVKPTLERWFTAPYRSAHPETMERIGKLIADTPVPGYVGCCRAIPKLNLTDRLKEIKVPIQIIVGADDQGTPVAMSQAIHENAPGSRLDILPAAAHLSNIEQPQAFDRALAEFLPT
ncbi:MAG: 3-oxoadipate enol-lactonase [Betaproteobacteria bacterium]|jgi:3-oxoadipate enol-lactonase|nr:3-oxoadipate enol-lactonase [Betaproteobacteria bacterium]